MDSESGAPVKGQTVRLRPIDTEGDPGAVIDTATTSDTGHFDLDSGSNPADEYYVQLVAGRYQGGYVGEEYVQPLAFAQTFGGGQDTGTVKALPAFIRGTVVNAKTLNPVAKVRVTARSQDEITEVDGADSDQQQGRLRDHRPPVRGRLLPPPQRVRRRLRVRLPRLQRPGRAHLGCRLRVSHRPHRAHLPAAVLRLPARTQHLGQVLGQALRPPWGRRSFQPWKATRLATWICSALVALWGQVLPEYCGPP